MTVGRCVVVWCVCVQVVVPMPFPEYTSRRVHVAEWLEGEKLSQSTADDVQVRADRGRRGTQHLAGSS